MFYAEASLIFEIGRKIEMEIENWTVLVNCLSHCSSVDAVIHIVGLELEPGCHLLFAAEFSIYSFKNIRKIVTFTNQIEKKFFQKNAMLLTILCSKKKKAGFFSKLEK